MLYILISYTILQFKYFNLNLFRLTKCDFKLCLLSLSQNTLNKHLICHVPLLDTLQRKVFAVCNVLGTRKWKVVVVCHVLGTWQRTRVRVICDRGTVFCRVPNIRHTEKSSFAKCLTRGTWQRLTPVTDGYAGVCARDLTVCRSCGTQKTRCLPCFWL